MKKVFILILALTVVFGLIGCTPDDKTISDDDKNKLIYGPDYDANADNSEYVITDENLTDIELDNNNEIIEVVDEVADEKDGILLNVSAVEKITIEFFSMGQTTEWELKADELSEWVTWAKGLSGNIVSDEKVAELQMTDGGESYHFTDGEQLSFSYVLNGSERYVVIDSTWYEIANPTDPF